MSASGVTSLRRCGFLLAALLVWTVVQTLA